VTPTILSREEIAIEREEDVVAVRRRVRAVAQERGFDTFAAAALTTATSELTRNVWVHARRGAATIEQLSDGSRFGVRIVFRDQGPGIPDVPRVFAGGFSTARSMGLGLSGSKRLVDEFTLETEVGRGTVVTVTKWTLF
jgi:serine/threonine-protein kinase RsbT